MRAAREQIDAVIALLAARFAQSFAMYAPRRKPLKIGLHHDIVAALGETVDRMLLAHVMCAYNGEPFYLALQRTGPWRIDLDGNVAGAVTAEEMARAQQRLAGINTRRKPSKVKPPVQPPEPQRLGLADLKAAAQRRKAAAAA